MVDGRTRTGKVVNQLKAKSPQQSTQEQTPIATGMYLPNHSGDHSAGRVLRTPSNDLDIANKKYVDDNAGGVSDHGALAGLSNDDHPQYQKETDFTEGSILFRGASAITEDNFNLFWDDTNNRLGIGTAAPVADLHLENGGSSVQTQINIDNYSNSANHQPVIRFRASDSDTVGTLATTQDGDILGDFNWFGVDSNNSAFGWAAAMRVTQDGAAGTTRIPAQMEFKTSPGGTTSPVTRMTVDKDGKVGIGTTIPDTLLHIEGSSAGAITNKIENTGTGTAATYLYSSRNNANDVVGQFAAFLDDDSIGGINFHRTANADEGYITFYTQTTGGSNSEKMRLSEDGDLGIGTPRPDYSFEVVRAGRNNNADASLTSYNDQPTWPSQLFFKKSNSDTLDRLEETQDGDRFGDILFYGVGSDTNSAQSARINITQDGAAGTTRCPAKIDILTSPGGTTAPVIHLTVRADGGIEMPTLRTTAGLTGELWNDSGTLKIS